MGRPTTHLLLLKRQSRARDREKAGDEQVRVVDAGGNRGWTNTLIMMMMMYTQYLVRLDSFHARGVGRSTRYRLKRSVFATLVCCNHYYCGAHSLQQSGNKPKPREHTCSKTHKIRQNETRHLQKTSPAQHLIPHHPDLTHHTPRYIQISIDEKPTTK